MRPNHALVQFAQLHGEKEQVLKHLEHSKRIAHTDPLTGLPKRFALDIELGRLPRNGALTFLDLDHLKYYNDQFEHVRGDEFVRSFSQLLAAFLGERANLYRVGGIVIIWCDPVRCVYSIKVFDRLGKTRYKPNDPIHFFT